MNLTTQYLGLKLKNPLMPGASPLADNLDTVRRLEDAGAAAIVLHSLFAEQLECNESVFSRHLVRWQDSFAEASTFFPEQEEYSLFPHEYLERIAKIKAAVQSQARMMPLNGSISDAEFNDLAAYIGKTLSITPTYIAVTTAPSVSVSATSLSFAAQNVGTNSSAQTVTVSNAANVSRNCRCGAS